MTEEAKLREAAQEARNTLHGLRMGRRADLTATIERLDAALLSSLDRPEREEGEVEAGYTVTGEVYEAAVKGRQDFRTAYRELLSVRRAAASLCLLWRTPGEKIGSDAFMEALNALDVATCGGGRSGIARPKLEALSRHAAQGDVVEEREATDRVFEVAFENRQNVTSPENIEFWNRVIGWLSNIFDARLPSDRARSSSEPQRGEG